MRGVVTLLSVYGFIFSTFADVDVLNMGVSTTRAIINAAGGDSVDVSDIVVTFDQSDVSGCKSLGEIDGKNLDVSEKGKLQITKNCPSPELYLSRVVKKRKGNNLLIKNFSDPCRVETYTAYAYFCPPRKPIPIPMH